MKGKHLLCLLTAAVAMTVNAEDNWTDVTSKYIADADFSSSTGWTTQTGVNDFDTSNRVAEVYAGWGSLSVTSGNISQSVTLPAGQYKMTGYAFYRYSGPNSPGSGTTSTGYMFAGSNSMTVGNVSSVDSNTSVNSTYGYANSVSDASVAFYTYNYYLNTLEFTLTEESTISIGYNCTHDAQYSWFIAGEVTLYKVLTEEEEAEMEAEALAEEREEVETYMKLFNCLHASTSLLTETEKGTTLTWSLTLDDGVAEYVTLDGTTLTVNSRPTETLTVGTLTATGSNGQTYTKRLTLAPDDNRYGYLYCYMSSSSEITNYALGTKDDKGHVFNELLDGAEIFDTDTIAKIEQGTRDAFIGRGQKDGEYFITVTDMCNATSGVWYNYGIDLLRSSDMIHWEGTTFDFRKGKSIFSDSSASTGVYDTDDEYANIYRVWAPQFIWDPTYNDGEGAYLVYYSILSSNSGDSYDRIFYSHTTDFKTLTQPRLLFDPGISVIDGDIIYNPYDSLYHMYYKREGSTGSDRGIYEATSATLTGGTWTNVLHVTNEGSEQVEGSSTIRRINEDVYNLYYMRYSGGSAYKYCETDYLGLNPTSSTALDGTGDFQHGSFLTLTEEEYTMLQAWSDVTLLLATVEELYESTSLTAYSEAIKTAEEALALTSVSELATALPKALEALKNAIANYVTDLALDADGEEVDITSVLTNADFSDGSSGWTGTSFTQATGTVAEFWNKTYDVWQILENMPAGTYRLTAQGFYRNGSNDVAYSAHSNGTEQLLAKLYLNSDSTTFVSLYDTSQCNSAYTYSPTYTYPDNITGANTAFNTNGYYSGNEVTCVLYEQADLKVGLCKKVAVDYDWNCFDNFKLYYTPFPTEVTLNQDPDHKTEYYGTYSNEEAKYLPTSYGVTPYALSGIEAGSTDGTLKFTFTALSESTDKEGYYALAAEEGYLLKRTATDTSEGTYVAKLNCTSDNIAAPTTNYLDAQLEAEDITADNWGEKLALYYYDESTYLGDNNGTKVYGEGMGFYTLRIGATLSANSAVIPTESVGTDSGAKAAVMVFEEGNADAIKAVQTDATQGDAVYDISGRRVSRPTKGIYIVNGKKVLY